MTRQDKRDRIEMEQKAVGVMLKQKEYKEDLIADPRKGKRGKKKPVASLEEFLRSLPASDFFGDDHRCHLSASARLVFQNVNGLLASSTGWKQLQINQWLKEEQVGIALLAETNTHWPSLPEGQNWNDRMRQVGSKGYYFTTAHNKNRARPIASCSQYGGCVATVLNSVAHQAKSFGRDPSKLGRWSYVRLRGKKFAMPSSDNQVNEAADASQSQFSKDLVVVAVYRPNPPGKGESTVWAQHRSFFCSQGRQRDPREAFMVDLLQAITQWHDKGCKVIVGVDANARIPLFASAFGA
ncbi:unnamed protein product [Cylindrotheca closterium]|uniref:Endonuclease/exonuclease/phosphatase domain-containing protein n=1 Tax=Cylindrotheca closterium TaxID=2856 RepID=A0AAD2G117_9STRA|nr:unnamed protein product [Cylindrotheca closterium]